jgi:hypothetical protein
MRKGALVTGLILLIVVLALAQYGILNGGVREGFATLYYTMRRDTEQNVKIFVATLIVIVIILILIPIAAYFTKKPTQNLTV